MSVIDLEIIKDQLRVFHDHDDIVLETLLDSAEDEAMRFMNRTRLPTLPVDYPETASSEDVPSVADPVAPSVITAVACLVKADYEATPSEALDLRKAAEIKLMPYRTGLGV